jgi:hypothetical protein
MTRLEALQELLKKVEAGSLVPENLIVDAETSAQIDAAINVSDLHGDAWADLLNAYDGSLDAAKALHDAALPDAAVQLTDMRPYRGSGGWLVSINWHRAKHQGANVDPAPAWLLAILKALIAQEQAA